jgi:tRNASer (uridine44-2'-O)-methyltransferase
MSSLPECQATLQHFSSLHLTLSITFDEHKTYFRNSFLMAESQNEAEQATDPPGAFSPRTPVHPLFTRDVGEGQWQPMLESDCTFEPEMFLKVMHNLIKNPNIMSTHLFRADILYDSDADHTIIEGPTTTQFSDFTKHLKKEYQPRYTELSGFNWERTYVRQLVPRNRQLDKDLPQTCHFYTRLDGETTRSLIIYIPHVEDSGSMPWYHPRVRAVAFSHDWTPTSRLGVVAVHYSLFPDVPLDSRLERTALQLLTKIHKHSKGQQAGYQKRVHHDLVVPQKTFQETYARLKSTYARPLIEGWAEVTDPAKHVFEDLGIASFLIELWKVMYDCDTAADDNEDAARPVKDSHRPPFPGFVDIGCGNGLLVNILIKEGFPGWGFDARHRKSWETYAPIVQSKLTEGILVPEVLNPQPAGTGTGVADVVDKLEAVDLLRDRDFHNGLFKKGTFIVSNHADELTPWTPLLAYLNDSPFIAIPCCSHNLAGARWRAPISKAAKEKAAAQRRQESSAKETNATDQLRENQAAETGSLKRPYGTKNVQSAYGSLCDYVSGLANDVGFVVETEILRIPSTRNICILGRKTKLVESDGETSKEQHVQHIIARELSAPLQDICAEFVRCAQKLVGKKGETH